MAFRWVLTCVGLSFLLWPGSAMATTEADALAVIAPATPATAKKQSAVPSVTAEYAILIDAADRRILFERSAMTPRPPASTTKIITALLGVDMGDPEEETIVSQHAGTTGEASIHLFPGERVLFGDLLTGALVKSGNDACVAIAEHIAGSEEFFALWMTTKARLLGAKHSHFYNPNGLPHRLHVASAYDLAVVSAEAMRKEAFAAIVKQRYATLEHRQGWPKEIKNTNKLLWSYPFADGIKTGTTKAAGACLVASATKGDKHLIAVVLHSDDRFGDCQRLLEYGFNK
ncbi:D-alanyl-D-alanine carboxypeptidase family protein [Heliophilum fasciatum]|uniref:D-alanyl-D-alanine carboxypeptidase (Penicillin-binding protein 5/6) n=1 Tax=Heliophilum fasciatum TaxID=35700 RepID=A0A4R2RMZ8_9FIRM|nr:D-alanyl-D-alanine carboxypeptidase family protein [Heliophilum fasciatum]MCW2277887.1 D-alanyl-D-alanine carboxypeptidase (penicillin-binding protein 5/6) [Heliophilum fasciatum]TCP64543.1 D-alanyl-D-alanine carboxypeptidase (penicillin-binding protein 5/6) [Heliophilum fasciatum]